MSAGGLMGRLLRRARPDRAEALSVPAAPGHQLVLPARHDALTGLLNQTVLVEHLQALLAGHRHDDRAIAVLTLDLAGFKLINEAHGHAAGDLLLRHAAARLLARLRESDVIARTGADAFTIVQSGIGAPAAAAALAGRLMSALQEPFDLAGRAVTVNVNIGCAIAPDDGGAPELLLERAASALERARLEEPSSCRFFNEVLDSGLRSRRALAQDLIGALDRGELELHYEPQVDLSTRRVVGVSARPRWQHPQRGGLGPDLLVPLAEDTGLILGIGAWMLEEACAQARRWEHLGAIDLRVGNMLSPVQFQEPDLCARVAAILERTGLDPDRLELQISGRCLLERSHRAVLEDLRGVGVRLAIDGFGVGPASFDHLRRLAVDALRLERSLVGALEDDETSVAIVRAASAFGRSLGIGVAAEGVANPGQLQVLAQEGCLRAQGPYFSPPLAAPEIDAMVQAAPIDVVGNDETAGVLAG